MNFYYPGNETVTHNTTNHNTGSGIYLEDNYGGEYNVKTASDNTADYNSDYGLYADYGAPGSANTALHNTPYDCYNFVCGSASTIPRHGQPDRP